VARVRRDEQRAMRDYQATDRCRMRFLREQLDDPGADDCGRCDNCGGLTVPAGIEDSALAAAGERLDRPGVPVDPRRMWPTAMPSLGIDVRGRIAAGEQAETGRAIARFTDLGLGQRVRSVLAPGSPDARVPDDLVHAAVQVLAAWGWERRPEAVVHVGSGTRAVLVADLAARLAQLGRLDDLGGIAHRGPPGEGRSNSAFRLRDVWHSYELPPGLGERVTGRSILLVDDRTDTGWTLTVVARLLRRAGAEAVYPFVLAAVG
jgi:ATP-dependent DNA helicase RecQ